MWHIQAPVTQLPGRIQLAEIMSGRALRNDAATYTSIKSFNFLCWTLCIVGQKVSTKSLMAASSDCFPSSSRLLLHEYWNFVPNNNNIPVKETKIWLSFKTWCSLSPKLLMPVLQSFILCTKLLGLDTTKTVPLGTTK